MIKIIWNDVVIAESPITIIIEGVHYFSRHTVRFIYLVPSETKTTSPWKGDAHHFHIIANDLLKRDAAWHYPSPYVGAGELADRIGFSPEITFHT